MKVFLPERTVIYPAETVNNCADCPYQKAASSWGEAVYICGHDDACADNEHTLVEDNAAAITLSCPLTKYYETKH